MGAFLPPAVSKRVPRLFQRAAAPASPRAGDIHADTTTAAEAVRAYFGGIWRPLQFMYDLGTGRVVDQRAYLGAAYALGIDALDGASHPASAVYASNAAVQAAFPLTKLLMAAVGAQAPQTTDELAWLAAQESACQGYLSNKAVYWPHGSAGQQWNRTVWLTTGNRVVGDPLARWGTQIKATTTFYNRLASGAIDTIQAMLRVWNQGAGIETTSRVYIEWLDLHGNDVRPAKTDGAMTASSATLTSAASTFTAAMVGAWVSVVGAGPNGSTLSTTIGAYVSATQVTLATAASTTVSGATIINSAEQVSGTRFILQQPSTIRQSIAEHFSGFGWWIEGQDCKLDRCEGLTSTVNLRLKDAQFISIPAMSIEQWLCRGFLIEAVEFQSLGSVWFGDLHCENGGGTVDDTWLGEVNGVQNVTIRPAHFTQFASTTKHNGVLVTGTDAFTSVEIQGLRNQATTTGGVDSKWAIRDYPRNIHLTWGQVGRVLNYAGVRNADSGTSLFPSWMIVGLPSGRRMDLGSTDPSKPLIDLTPGAAATGDTQTWRDLPGAVVVAVDRRGQIRGALSAGANAAAANPLSTLHGGFGQAQNYLLNSCNPSGWTAGASATITANAVAAPDGSMTAAQVDFSGITNAYVRPGTSGATNKGGAVLCTSQWIKGDAAGTIALWVYGTGGTQQVLTLNVTTAWQRLYDLVTIPGGDNGALVYDIRRTSTSHLTRVYLGPAQLEDTGPFPGPIIRTTSTVAKSTATPGFVPGKYGFAAIGGYARGSRLGYNVGGGTIANNGAISFPVTVPGVKGPASVADGAITTGTPNLTSATAAFTTDDVGKAIQVAGAYSRSVADAAITSGAAVLTSATAAFTADDLGRTVAIAGAGPAGATLTTTITVVTNATTVTVAANASTTVSGAALTITGTLNTSISAYVSATAVTLTANASATVSGATVTLIRDVWLCRVFWSAVVALGTKWTVVGTVTADDTVTVLLTNSTGVSRTLITSDTYVTAERWA